MDKDELFNLISDSVLYGNLGLFIGAGFPKAVSQIEPSHQFQSYTWPELLTRICYFENLSYRDIVLPGLYDELKSKNIDLYNLTDYIKYSDMPLIATKICKEIAHKSGIEYNTAVKKFKHRIAHVTNQFPSKQQRDLFNPIIASLDPAWIVTTNYDHIIESLIPEKAVAIKPNEVLQCRKDKIPVYHLHGSSRDPDSIVITSEDYQSLNFPHDYRMDKMTILFKESTTLMIGYGIGDPNVKTALNWSKNIYSEYSAKNSERVIQFAYSKNPNPDVIIEDNLIILETSDLTSLLKNLTDFINQKRNKFNKELEVLKTINEHLNKADDKTINKFLTNDNGFRTELYKLLESQNENIYLEVFLEEVFKQLQGKQHEDGNFDGYKNNIEIAIDFLKNIPLNFISPSLLEIIISDLDSVMGYLGYNIGDSFAATEYWNVHKNEILPETYEFIKAEINTKLESCNCSSKWKKYI